MIKQHFINHTLFEIHADLLSAIIIMKELNYTILNFNRLGMY